MLGKSDLLTNQGENMKQKKAWAIVDKKTDRVCLDEGAWGQYIDVWDTRRAARENCSKSCKVVRVLIQETK